MGKKGREEESKNKKKEEKKKKEKKQLSQVEWHRIVELKECEITCINKLKLKLKLRLKLKLMVKLWKIWRNKGERMSNYVFRN